MLSLDISRDSFQRPKNYSGLRQQQGRIPLDSELNESADILAEELRRAIRDVICNSGTPDDGFLVSNVTVIDSESFTFDIAAGTYYIGGVRYDALNESTFLTQPDWMQLEFDLDPLPAPPESAVGGALRHDFVYLEGWEQDVSATEDSELFETALGGADGAGRERRMARVNVIENSADNCVDALEAAFPASMRDPSTWALVSGAGLTVGFNDEGVEENLCAPQTQAGYLGAENETFRVQLTAPDRFIYGRDNAAPLYRVQLEVIEPSEDAPPGTPPMTRVTFLTRPRDVWSQPLAGQAVEIFRWNTRLPNGEKLAEPIGTLATIATDYDPDGGTLLLHLDLESDWIDWFTGGGSSHINPMDEADVAAYFYLRVWTGGSGDADEPDHPITAGAIPLPGTGLEVTFAPTGTPGVFGESGEYWVVAARPASADVVTPWRLLDESIETPPPSPPMGPIRHVAPVALITWAPDAAGTYQPVVHDCRERFRKLCKVGTCCEVTVGDGVRSFGDVNNIVEAVARLPASGGKVCLLRGHHSASVELSGLHDIVFSGCGDQTIWSADESQAAISAAVLLAGCERIHFQDLVMEASEHDIVRQGSRQGETLTEERSSEVSFLRVKIRAQDASALWLNGCDGVSIRECTIVQEALRVGRSENPAAGNDPLVFALGDDLHIEHCRLLVDSSIAAESRPLGGLQIGGTSTCVVIRDNRIVGGKGNGITLGHIEWIEDGVDDREFGRPWTLGSGFVIDENGCLVPAVIPIPPESGDDIVLVPASGGEVRDLVIDQNLIASMGLNGISISHFFDLETVEDFISISRAEITKNTITGCLRTDLETPPIEMRFFMGYGGIALAACDLLAIEDNRIFGNAATASAPNAGIFVLLGAGLEINNNRIYDNGAIAERSEVLEAGRRGGVNIGWCVTFANEPIEDERTVPPRIAALSMSGNFIDSAHGRALKVTALGPVNICGNRLIGAGTSQPEFIFLGLLLTFFPQLTGILSLMSALISIDPVTRRDFASDRLEFSELLIAALGGNAVSVFNLAFLEEFVGIQDDDVPGGLSDRAVGGETMFDNNQVGFRPHSTAATTHTSAVLVASLDDVSVSHNQIECDTGFDFVLSNAFALGTTVRLIGNRLQEQFLRTFFSGYSHGLFLNTTAINQGTHCFAVTTLFNLGGANRVNQDNLSLIDSLIGGDGGICPVLENMLTEFESGGDGSGGELSDNEFFTVPEVRLDLSGMGTWGRYPFLTFPSFNE